MFHKLFEVLLKLSSRGKCKSYAYVEPKIADYNVDALNWSSERLLTTHNAKCFTNSSRRFRREIMFENDTTSYTVFAPAELLRNW
jgi:hypothetical protein